MNDWRNILWVATVCILYLATAKLGTVTNPTAPLFWPPSGVALAATLLGGYRLLAGIALGSTLVSLGSSLPVVAVAAIALGSTLEPLCGAALLRRRKDFSIDLDKVSDVFALSLSAAMLSTAISATLGTLGLLASREIAAGDASGIWALRWLGNGMGVLVISPILLAAARTARGLPASLPWAKSLEALALIAASAGVGLAIFNNPALADAGHIPVFLSLFPFAVWGALRFGAFGAATVALLVSLPAIQNTAQSAGPFIAKLEAEGQIHWCLFTGAMAFTGLLLSAIGAEREKALEALRNANKDLERQVQKRTSELTQANADLQAALAERKRLQLEMSQTNEERQKMIGQELHDGLGQQLTGISFMLTYLHETLDAKSAPEAPTLRRIIGLLGEAMVAIRSLSRGLYPIALETGGLAYALRQLAEHAQNYSKLQCAVHCMAEEQAIDATTALNLYRIAQEAVCNALRHGQAKRIDIELSGNGGHYELSVVDDGIGLPDRKAGATLGLRSMRCRAELIGAKLEIQKNPAGGTWVVVTGSTKQERNIAV